MIFSSFFKRRKLDDNDEPAGEPEVKPERPNAKAKPAINGLPRFQDRATGVSRRPARNPIRARMRTAFTPTQPVSNVAMFAGRRETLLTLIRSIEDQEIHVVIYGDRGIGKTSLLHVTAYLAREAGYLVRYVSCSESSEFGEIFRRIASDIPQIYHNEIDPTSQRAEQGATLAELLPGGPVSVAAISELFSKLTGTRFLIILDEFDRSDSATFRRQVAELIKTLSDQSTRVQIVIAGVAGNLTELIQHIPSIRRNVIGLPVPNMLEPEIRELIEIGSRACGLPYTEEACAMIVRLANGSPYLTSLLAQHAGVAALDRSATRVDVADMLIALSRSIAEVEQRVAPETLHNFAKISDIKAHAVLTEVSRQALAMGGRIRETPSGGDVDEALYVKALEALDTQHNLLRPTPLAPGGGYEFRDDGAALYFWLRSAYQRETRSKWRGGAAA